MASTRTVGWPPRGGLSSHSRPMGGFRFNRSTLPSAGKNPLTKKQPHLGQGLILRRYVPEHNQHFTHKNNTPINCCGLHANGRLAAAGWPQQSLSADGGLQIQSEYVALGWEKSKNITPLTLETRPYLQKVRFKHIQTLQPHNTSTPKQTHSIPSLKEVKPKTNYNQTLP